MLPAPGPGSARGTISKYALPTGQFPSLFLLVPAAPSRRPHLTNMDIEILVAGPEHTVYARAICNLIEESAKARGTGIAKREPAYVEEKNALR